MIFLKSAVPSPCPSKQHGPFRTELCDPFHGLLVPSRGNVLAIVGREELDESSQLLVLWSPKAFHDARRGPCADEFENRSERGIRASAVGFTQGIPLVQFPLGPQNALEPLDPSNVCRVVPIQFLAEFLELGLPAGPQSKERAGAPCHVGHL